MVSVGSSCFPCPPAHYSNEVGSHNCYSCFLNQTAVYGSKECSYCDLGQVPEPIYQESCLSCEPGSFAGSGFIVCSPCNPGHSSNKSSSSICQECDKGQYCNTSGCINCELCLPGQYANQTASTKCLPCSIGYYANRSGMENCMECEAGTISTKEGSSTCSQCLPGTFTNKNATSECFPCNEGTYTDIYGSKICKTCPDGMYCSIASVTPILQSLQTPSFNVKNSLGKKLPKDPGFKIYIILLIVFLVSVVVLIVMWKILRSKFPVLDKRMKKFDIFYSLAHRTDINTPVMREQTKLGGWLTIITFLIMILACTFVISNFVHYNVKRSTSYFPEPFSHSLSAPQFSSKLT